MFKVPKNVLVSLNSKNINENKSVAFFLPGLEGNSSSYLIELL